MSQSSPAALWASSCLAALAAVSASFDAQADNTVSPLDSPIDSRLVATTGLEVAAAKTDAPSALNKRVEPKPVAGVKAKAPPRPGKRTEPAPAETTAAGQGEGEVETLDLSPEANDGKGGETGTSGVHANAESLMGDDYPQMDRVFDHHTAKVTRRRTVATLIGHRNYEGILRDPWRDLVGFDGGSLKVLLGARYGVLDLFDVGVARMNRTFERYTTWELDTKVQLFRQERVGIDLALRAGMDIFESPSSTSAGFLGQLLISRTLSDRALVGAGVLFSSLSSGQYKRDSDPSSSTALMVEAELRVLDTLSLAVEAAYNIAGFGESWPVVTYGPKFVTNRHTFSIVISNSQYVTADSLVANTYRSNWRDWLLGFHITREI